MTISLNGEKVDTRGAEDIAQLIDRFQLPPDTIFIEHNGVALHRHEWPQRPLSEGDQVEFLRIVAGG
jgi:thiamine biosynthesis protein ThiS